MAILSHKCPHCLTENIALRIAASLQHDVFAGIIHLDCPKCALPSAALIESATNQTPFPNAVGSSGDVQSLRFDIKNFWPAAPGPIVPENLPPIVERAFLQAERNIATPGNEEAAGIMYRRALEVGLKVIAPDLEGTLYQRIKRLADDHRLTPALSDWAHEIRLLGNISAHDESAPTGSELAALRSFADLVLRYLFTLPAMLEMRRAAAAKPKT
jgi:hypothetical protein